MKVSFHRLARGELIAAANYLERKAGLGAEFLDSFEAWAQNIVRFPESAPLIGRNIRKGVLLRFNYIITYEVGFETIRVLYVRHAKRQTSDWEARR
jgi:plasmid stabilization system protein ParE